MTRKDVEPCREFRRASLTYNGPQAVQPFLISYLIITIIQLLLEHLNCLRANNVAGFAQAHNTTAVALV